MKLTAIHVLDKFIVVILTWFEVAFAFLLLLDWWVPVRSLLSVLALIFLVPVETITTSSLHMCHCEMCTQQVKYALNTPPFTTQYIQHLNDTQNNPFIQRNRNRYNQKLSQVKLLRKIVSCIYTYIILFYSPRASLSEADLAIWVLKINWQRQGL